MLFIYIDDGGIVASKEVIEEIIEALGKEFKIKRLGPMHEMIGCTLTISKDGKTLWITQPKLIKHMKELFLDELPTKEAIIPATSGSMVTRPKEEKEKITPDEQSKYRSGVGMLLYLIKHS